MNTAARDRALLPTAHEVIGGRTPVSKLKLSKEKDGSLKVTLHTSRPDAVRIVTKELTEAFKEKIGGDRSVTVEVVPEARAVAKYLRLSPRKARLVIDAIKGKRASDALAALRFVPNQAAEHISKVLISAVANAQDGWGAGVEELKVTNILADGGPSLKRVRARAQGRAYRILKRTSHLTVILTEAAPIVAKPKRVAAPAKPKAVAAAPAVATAAAAEAPVAEETTSPVETVVEETSTPVEATPVEASDAPEIDMSDRAADTSEGADQPREQGE
ncbi:MAG: 50S ribosomal protein L22 [Capsulimonas sp.]|uniref:50S ribosomal protein L22 n=1 Tax=Capsulimonas sp. TaxID=2494211 RepID=UPI003267CDB9